MGQNINSKTLRAFRRKSGHTQESLADDAGVSVRTVQRAEGDGRTRPDTLLQFATVLQVHPDELRVRDRELPSLLNPRPIGGHVVLIASTKGGTGRTILAISLAGLLQKEGHHVCLLDFHYSRGVSFYLSSAQTLRQPVPTCVHCNGPKEAAGRLSGLRQAFDYVVIDTSAYEEAELVPLALMADRVLLTTSHPIFDFGITHRVSMWQSAAIPLYDKISIVHTIANRYERHRRDGLEFLRTIGLPLCKTVLQNRVAYEYALAQGRTVTTDDPKGLAATEIRQLCYELGWISDRPSSAVRDRRRTKADLVCLDASLDRALTPVYSRRSIRDRRRRYR